MEKEQLMDSLVGKTVRWTFTNGPVAGKTYEHTFNQDGSVDYRPIDARSKGKPTHEKRCATVKVTDGIFAVSYLGASGYALTVVLNFRSGEVVGFASNEKDWAQQKGSFEIVVEPMHA